MKEVGRRLSRIADFPEAWAPVSSGARRCLVERFPYGIIYQIRDDKILILAVMHLSRKPDYWKNRLWLNKKNGLFLLLISYPDASLEQTILHKQRRYPGRFMSRVSLWNVSCNSNHNYFQNNGACTMKFFLKIRELFREKEQNRAVIVDRYEFAQGLKIQYRSLMWDPRKGQRFCHFRDFHGKIPDRTSGYAVGHIG